LAIILALGFSPFVKIIPWSAEKKLGEVYGVPASWRVCDENATGRNALNKLLKRIYPIKKDDQEFSVSLSVIQSKEVNAFATLGGRIFIYEELIKRATTPEELAGILAHEIEHVRNRHVLEGILMRLVTFEGLRLFFSGSLPDVAGTFLHMRFTRFEEEMADKEGLERLGLAKVSPKGMYDFFERMREDSALRDLLSDHPSDQKRLDAIRPYLKIESSPVLEIREWEELRNICKL
jgi:predicted Zn-dependent protease